MPAKPEQQTYDPNIQAPGKDIPGQGKQEGQQRDQQQTGQQRGQQKEEEQRGQQQNR